MGKTKKHDEYAVIILAHLQEMLSGESENKIDIEELADDKNATAFFHALANLAPTIIYQKLTGQEVDIVEFNHIANRMCFQFANPSPLRG